MLKWIFLFLWISSPAICQQLVEGRVLDSESGKPVPFASIGVVGTAQGTSSNLDGQFSLVVEGDVSLRITCVGYESLTIQSKPDMGDVELRPMATQLKELIVFGKDVNPSKVVRKALAGIAKNFSNSSFFQSFFYRHYCKDEETYGRLIEAFVEVWKQNGYSSFRSSTGQREQLRITQLRRSLDRTAIAQSHEPIAIGGVLQADLVAYQTSEESEQLRYYDWISSLRMDVEDYDFKFVGITTYDGSEVYEIQYEYIPSEEEGARAHPNATGLSGTLFIATDSYAIVRTEELRHKGGDSIRTSGFYRKYNDRYYPYRLIRDGGTFSDGKRVHWFHIDLMSVEISQDGSKRFEGSLPDKEQMLSIPYDSTYWNSQTILKATPLENEIVRDLGGGKSLNRQFDHYRQFEMNTRNGGDDGDKKLSWLIDFSKGSRPLVLCYWSTNCTSYLAELEYFKRMNTKYRERATFAMVSVDDDDARWKEVVQKFNFSSDGILQYRLGSDAGERKRIKQLPAYVFFSSDGLEISLDAARPGDPAFEERIKGQLQRSKH